MACTLQYGREQGTSCSNCVVACPADSAKLLTDEPAATGDGVCIERYPHDSIRLTGLRETRAEAKVQ